jgi:hypothetical protein
VNTVRAAQQEHVCFRCCTLNPFKVQQVAPAAASTLHHTHIDIRKGTAIFLNSVHRCRCQACLVAQQPGVSVANSALVAGKAYLCRSLQPFIVCTSMQVH